MSAYNDWQIANWVERDDRLYGSIHVNPWDPDGAVREIERLAEHPRIVQVMLYIGDQAYGHPRYHPIFAAAARHGLVVGIHHSEQLADRARLPPLLRRVAHARAAGLHVAGRVA